MNRRGGSHHNGPASLNGPGPLQETIVGKLNENWWLNP